jgi:hypothetical protein
MLLHLRNDDVDFLLMVVGEGSELLLSSSIVTANADGLSRLDLVPLKLPVVALLGALFAIGLTSKPGPWLPINMAKRAL